MKRLLQRLAVGTPLEPTARTIHGVYEHFKFMNMSPDTIKERGRLYDFQLYHVMTRVLSKNSNCVDVGSLDGRVLRWMLYIAPKGLHFAFEPIPYYFKKLINKSYGRLPNVHIHNLALSDSAGEVSFQYCRSNPGYSGLRRTLYPKPNHQVEEITVRTERLDNIVARDVPIHFIKIDVEGAELQVLRGAVETIRRNRPVIAFEHGLGAADQYGTTPENVFDLIAGECGLKVSLLSAWLDSGGKPSLSREAFSDEFSSGRNSFFLAHP